MPSIGLKRFACVALLFGALLGAASQVAADEAIPITWKDLIPASATESGEDQVPTFGVVQHGQMTAIPGGSQVVTDYNDKVVSLPGFVIPIEFDGTGMASFLLVPFVGACIHVPPPPPNQLVFVTANKPLPLTNLFEAVTVTGTFATAATRTDLADVGYVMKADEMVPYDG